MFIEPVFGKKFFGREEVLGTLKKRVTALKGGYRQNMALTGPMLAGKSSILRHFLNNITDPGIIPLYIEMDGVDFRIFCMQFMSALLYHYLKSKEEMSYEFLRHLQKEVQAVERGDEREHFEILKKMCCKMIPETVECMTEVCKFIKQKKYNAAYEKLLEVTSVFKTETDKNCIVILDEFHNLSNFKLRRPFQTFGKIIMLQKNTMYIVSSSQKTLLKEILSEKLSLLFGNFEVIEINGFDSRTARSFISDKMEDFESLKEVKDYFIQISQGNPFYLEVFITEFSELKNKRGDDWDVKECLLEVFARTLYDTNGVLNQYFTNNLNFFLEKKARKKFIPILSSLARGNNTIKAIQKDLGRIDKDLGIKLQKLQDMDLLYNSGVFYKISDKLFEYWIKNVYFLRAQSMINDLDIKYLEFKRLMETDYREYCEFNRKSVVDIVCNLLQSFNNNKVQVNMNCRRMPRFDEVKSCNLSKNITQIKGRVANKEWLCHVKQDNIADENDVYELWSLKTKDKKSRIVRKIIMPLNGIEQNAFLLAKEQNIWIWDVQQLNRNLRLFGKFELVL